jgi:hypothetical protein
MSYLIHKQFQDKKNLDLQKILGIQKANQTGQEQTIVKRNHSAYGDYYEIISHQEADQTGEHVLLICRPLPLKGVLAGVKHGKVKPANNTGQSE